MSSSIRSHEMGAKRSEGGHLDLRLDRVYRENIGVVGLSEDQVRGIHIKLDKIHRDLMSKLDQPDVLAREQMAWFNLGKQDAHHLHLIEQYAGEIRAHYDYLLVIGIGGSSLGSKALIHAFQYADKESKKPKIIYLENADPENITAFECELKSRFGRLDYRGVAVNVISKSGTTAETAANFEVIIQHMKESGLSDMEISRRVIATTDEHKGSLRKISLEKGYRTLIVPEGVGGRFSVFSDVGLLPLAVGDVDIHRLMIGIQRGFDRVKLRPGDIRNHAFQIGSILYSMDVFLGKKLHGLFFFGDAFEGIASWFEQLWAESLGKNGQGPRPLGMIGARANHTVHQDNVGGKPNKVVLFISVNESRQDCTIEKSELGLKARSHFQILDAILETSRCDLQKAGRPYFDFVLDHICEESLGEMLFTLEVATHVAGSCYGVNPYDQPAVEEAKIGARNSLVEAQKNPSAKQRFLGFENQLSFERAMALEVGSIHGIDESDAQAVRDHSNAIHKELSNLISSPVISDVWMNWLKSDERIDIPRIQKVADQIAEVSDVLVVAGMGGAVSSKALVTFQNHRGCVPHRPAILYLDNVDPEAHVNLERKIKDIQGGKINHRRIAFNFISQSGNTVETLANLDTLIHKLRYAGWTKSDFSQKFVVTTNQEGGRLLEWARANQVVVMAFPSPMMGLLGIFCEPGLFPLALTGADIRSFMSGCKRAKDRVLRDCAGPDNHAFRMAETFYLLDRLKGKDLHGFFLYADSLKSTGEWLEQLWAEGLGKSDTVGPRPLAMIGTTAQHSVNQDNIAGRNDKAILLVGAHEFRSDFCMPGESVDYLRDNAMSYLMLSCLKGTSDALTRRNRPNMTYLMPKLSLDSLGEFLMTMALTLHIAGRLYGVDTYRQSAVEEGKEKLKKLFLI